jgi:hypothetical protein
MDDDEAIARLRHVRDSSRLNARTLRQLGEDPSKAGHSALLRKRADEIEQFADQLDRYMESRED